jgi:hypothetical protein
VRVTKALSPHLGGIYIQLGLDVEDVFSNSTLVGNSTLLNGR